MQMKLLISYISFYCVKEEECLQLIITYIALFLFSKGVLVYFSLIPHVIHGRQKRRAGSSSPQNCQNVE